jgi:hypothetical protein
MKDDNTKKIQTKPAQEWPNTVTTRAELDDALDKGSQSGRSERTIEDIYKAALLEFDNER